jgi:hypothetical protein
VEPVNRSPDHFTILPHNASRQRVSESRFAGRSAPVDCNPDWAWLLERSDHCSKLVYDAVSGGLRKRFWAVNHMTTNTRKQRFATSKNDERGPRCSLGRSEAEPRLRVFGCALKRNAQLNIAFSFDSLIGRI